MDDVILDLVLEQDKDKKKKLAQKIIGTGYKNGVYPSSIHTFYAARGKEGFGGFTVPAINLRCLTYDLSKAIFRVARRIKSGAFIFEIAKSEMGYTDQPPMEYASVIVAAAIKERYSGPIFIQGDHFQVNAKKYKENPETELGSIRSLIISSMEAGFYNIDIDSSTLVDLSKTSVKKQQMLNYEVCAKLTQFIRQNQPRGLEVSVGGEIGEVGGTNSNPEELRAYMAGYLERLRKGRTGISKISVQTGTSHGGVVLPDGSIAKVKVDFDTLKALSKIAREEYGLAGAVQHGASTLPAEAFNRFPETETAEVHLATEFQNMVFESKHLPSELKSTIYQWLKTNCAAERKADETDEQFIYKTRKKALGAFKKDLMGLPTEIRNAIAKEIEQKFEFLFGKLNIANTRELIEKHVELKRVISRKRDAEPAVHQMDSEGAD